MTLSFSLLAMLSSCDKNETTLENSTSTETTITTTIGVNQGVEATDTSIKEIAEIFSDYFVIDGVLYSNIQNDPQQEEYEYVKGDAFGEILYNTEERDLSKLDNGSASNLPVGTVLYKFPEDATIILAEVDNKLIPYIKIVEG